MMDEVAKFLRQISHLQIDKNDPNAALEELLRQKAKAKKIYARFSSLMKISIFPMITGSGGADLDIPDHYDIAVSILGSDGMIYEVEDRKGLREDQIEEALQELAKVYPRARVVYPV